MTKEELAAALDGIDIENAISSPMAEIAKRAGLVIVHGESDETMKFFGAIEHEIDAYEGTAAAVDAEGLIPNFYHIDKRGPDAKDELREYFRREKGGMGITAIWRGTGEGPAWSYETYIPHATFMILEDGKPWCRGIVFALADLAEVAEGAGHE